MTQESYETYKLGDWDLQSGEKILDAHIAYKTFGDPKSPAIVYPSWYSGCKSGLHSELSTYLTRLSDIGQLLADRPRQDS